MLDLLSPPQPLTNHGHLRGKNGWKSAHVTNHKWDPVCVQHVGYPARSRLHQARPCATYAKTPPTLHSVTCVAKVSIINHSVVFTPEYTLYITQTTHWEGRSARIVCGASATLRSSKLLIYTPNLPSSNTNDYWPQIRNPRRVVASIP